MLVVKPSIRHATRKAERNIWRASVNKFMIKIDPQILLSFVIIVYRNIENILLFADKIFDDMLI